MNDLVSILRKVPIGTTLWTPIAGDVTFEGIDEEVCREFPIKVKYAKNLFVNFTADGRVTQHKGAELLLFPSKDQRDWQLFAEQLANEPDEPRTILPNGVYIVYTDGHYERYRNGLKRDEGMRVGISWDGHTWILGRDYGDRPWSTASREQLEDNTCRIMKEYEAVLDWDFWGARSKLIGLWGHIPFADDETMPTCPMVLVQEHLATQSCLNDALRFCRLPEYEVEKSRWSVGRYLALSARVFYGSYGFLSSSGVYYVYCVQAVTPWNIE